MMRSLTVLLLLLSVNAFSQTNNLQYYKEIIKQGLCETHTKKCKQQTTRYFEACENAGNFYYSQKQYRKAIHYYEKISNLVMDGHGFLSFSFLQYNAFNAYRRIIKRLGDMSFDGIGKDKSLTEAYWYYNTLPSPFDDKQLALFSLKIFGDTTKVIFDKEKSSDTVKIFYINPLFIKDTNTTGLVNRQMKDIDRRILQDTTKECLLSMNAVASEESVATRHIFLDGLIHLKGNESVDNYTRDIIIDEDFLLPIYQRHEISYITLKVGLNKR